MHCWSRRQSCQRMIFLTDVNWQDGTPTASYELFWFLGGKQTWSDEMILNLFIFKLLQNLVEILTIKQFFRQYSKPSSNSSTSSVQNLTVSQTHEKKKHNAFLVRTKRLIRTVGKRFLYFDFSFAWTTTQSLFSLLFCVWWWWCVMHTWVSLFCFSCV